jgi:hypothetical protein
MDVLVLGTYVVEKICADDVGLENGLDRAKGPGHLGASFISSHLVDALIARGAWVRIVDDLSSGSRENIGHHLSNGRVELVRADLKGRGVARKALDAELAQLERRYSLLSADFYHLYKAGELEQDRHFIQ